MNDPETNESLLTPFLAVMDGRDEDEQFILSGVFISLSEKDQEVLSGEGTVRLIHQWVTDGLMPSTHAMAVAKIIGLVALSDEVSTSAIPILLEKIGVPPQNVGQLSAKILELLGPIILERAEEEVPEMATTEMPPMTRPTESGPRPLSPQPPSRNIIDLRKQRPTDA